MLPFNRSDENLDKEKYFEVPVRVTLTYKQALNLLRIIWDIHRPEIVELGYPDKETEKEHQELYNMLSNILLSAQAYHDSPKQD